LQISGEFRVYDPLTCPTWFDTGWQLHIIELYQISEFLVDGRIASQLILL